MAWGSSGIGSGTWGSSGTWPKDGAADAALDPATEGAAELFRDAAEAVDLAEAEDLTEADDLTEVVDLAEAGLDVEAVE